MPYEIDFIGISKNKATQDADAISLRWKNDDGSYTVGVIDVGFGKHGKALVEHINQYYFDDEYNLLPKKDKIIDFIIVTHTDNDHTIGLPQLLCILKLP